jgi:3',5'-cyclic AMP phosphodiesterase CpdA
MKAPNAVFASCLVALAVMISACGTTSVSERATTSSFPTVTDPAPVTRSDDVVRMVFVGDTGSGTDAQQEIADRIGDVDDENDLDWLVLLGDMIYEVGDPSLIPEVVVNPYRSSLDGTTRLIPVLGNHDIGSGKGDEILKELGAPGAWYTIESNLVTIVVLDSNRPDDQNQLTFLRSALATADSRWVMVVLHHPPYSAGVHGSSSDVRDAFAPLFEEYGVDLVFAGHDHDYQRSLPINGVTYVVSGGGSRVRPTGTADFTAVSASTLNFVSVTATDTALIAVVYSPDDIVDRFEIR